MEYRLIEDHPVYGWFGKLISHEDLLAIHHAERSLFEPCQPTDPFYYRVCTETGTDEKVCYGLDNYREASDLTKKMLPEFSNARLMSVLSSVMEHRTFDVRLEDKQRIHYKFTNT